MNELNTLNINYNNVKNVREQIRQKKGSNPYFADINTGSVVLTDYDNFPYNRWFRGKPYSNVPIVEIGYVLGLIKSRKAMITSQQVG
jgi:hypothetical protein